MATLTGNKLAALLKERGMSQKELAEAACLTPASVSRYVNGEREPRAHTVAALADVLGVKPLDIIGTYDEQEMVTAIRFIVLTVFGKDNYMNYFQGALTPDKIVYIDKKQGQKLERLAERQLFGNYSSLDPNCIIHQPQCIYKLKEMESIDRARSLTNKALETRDSCESLANQRNVVEHDSHEERI